MSQAMRNLYKTKMFYSVNSAMLLQRKMQKTNMKDDTDEIENNVSAYKAVF